jgi:hypothetical protein
MHAALETALEKELPAEAEAMNYPPSAVDEAPSGPVNVFLPRRRPVVPPPAVPGDDDAGLLKATPTAAPAPTVTHKPPDLALLDQVLRGLQRLP